MYYVKTLFFLGCCFLLGICIARGIQHFRGRTADAFEMPHTGIGNAPRMRGLALPLNGATAGILANLPTAQLHATAVSVSYPAAGSAGKALSETVAAAHRRGLELLLLPPGGFSRGNPYPQPLEAIAQEAQAAHVDCLCLSWLKADPDAAYWAREAAAVRRIYTGKLILAATPEVILAIDSFDAVDYVGVIGPVTLARRLPHAPDDVDLHAMRIFWACVLDSLESRALKAARPLTLLNMEVPATICAKLPLPDEGPPPPTPNPALQMTAYEALLVETKGRTYMEGLFVPWSPAAGGADGIAAAQPEAVNRFPELVGKIQDLWSETNPVPPPATSPPPPETDADTEDFGL